ncbi:hypothetical protein [Streptomyces sp. NPDC056982]|uniref:hypothetical protein n=1 Tax=Streptomyces sp. NPDC056982 TaxID=3345986 RepID=UPI0036415D14
MGAALHLAHAHQPAPPKKRKPKRKGGGDGAKFSEYAQRIYSDDRAGSETRSLLLAIAYVITMVPLDDDTTVWKETAKALGRPRLRHRGSVQDLVGGDIPRYEAPGSRYADDPMDRLCMGPRVRPHPDGPDDWRNTMKVCGAPAQEKAIEKDPVTGWHTNRWFCPRHRDHLLRVRAQVRAQNESAPEPIPNKGGLLPCYFDSDWVRVYSWGRGWDWEPPSYGYRADDWPVPGKEPVPQRARLRLVIGGGLEDA